MAHVQHRPERKRPWQVRYRDPSGRERARSFLRKSDAHRFAISVEATSSAANGPIHDSQRPRTLNGPNGGFLRNPISNRRLWPATSPTSALMCSQRSESTSFAISTAWRDHGPTRCRPDRHRLLRDGSGGL